MISVVSYILWVMVSLVLYLRFSQCLPLVLLSHILSVLQLPPFLVHLHYMEMSCYYTVCDRRQFVSTLDYVNKEPEKMFFS